MWTRRRLPENQIFRETPTIFAQQVARKILIKNPRDMLEKQKTATLTTITNHLTIFVVIWYSLGRDKK